LIAENFSVSSGSFLNSSGRGEHCHSSLRSLEGKPGRGRWESRRQFHPQLASELTVTAQEMNDGAEKQPCVIFAGMHTVSLGALVPASSCEYTP
jgi:hypothetical protein